jgi:hypothetical protein
MRTHKHLSEDKLRLFKLIEHWVHHNGEHRRRFDETAFKADEMGLMGVAEEMRLTVKASESVSEHLLKAMKYLGKKDV